MGILKALSLCLKTEYGLTHFFFFGSLSKWSPLLLRAILYFQNRVWYVWFALLCFAIFVAWLIHMCYMTHSYVCHDSFMRVPWLIHTCAMSDLIWFAFITGNSSLEHLLEGLWTQIHMDLSSRGFGRNRTQDLQITHISVRCRDLIHCATGTNESLMIHQDPLLNIYS